MFRYFIEKLVLIVVLSGFTMSVYAQENDPQLTIHVIDSDSISLQQVIILLNNEKTITTDENGFAKINLPIGNYTLKFSHPVYETQ